MKIWIHQQSRDMGKIDSRWCNKDRETVTVRPGHGSRSENLSTDSNQLTKLAVRRKLKLVDSSTVVREKLPMYGGSDISISTERSRGGKKTRLSYLEGAKLKTEYAT